MRLDHHDNLSVAGVTPYLLDSSSDILSKLKLPPINARLAPKITVPVYTSIDVTGLVKENSRHILQSSHNAVNASLPLDTNSAEIDNDVGMADEEPKLFVEVSQILPSNYAAQMTTVIIRGFPHAKPKAVEQILDTLLGVKHPHKAYTWSFVIHDYVEHFVLVVQLSSLAITKWFLQTYREEAASIIGAECVIISNPELDAILDKIEQANRSVDLVHVASTIQKILQNPANRDAVSNQSGTEDLDKVMSYYKNYKVDPNDLIDVPSDMKSNIVAEIVTFRSKVLDIERRKRKREIEDERMKTKQRLKQIFEEVREAHVEDAAGENEQIDENDDYATDPEVADLDEDEYRDYLEMKRVDDMEREYNKRLKSLQATEESGRMRLIEKLSALKNYEEDLIENKLRYMDEVKAQATKISLMDTTHMTGHSASLLDLYTTNHDEYARKRENIRVAEEEADARDKLQEEETNAGTRPMIDDPTPSDMNNALETSVLPESSSKFNMTILDSQNSAVLRDKISDLVAEYLGIRDDFLIQSVYSNLQQNGLAGKEALIADLSDVLDDDAASLVNDLWKFTQDLGGA